MTHEAASRDLCFSRWLDGISRNFFARWGILATNLAIKANLSVNLLHSLLVSCGDTTAAKHNIHLFECQSLGLWYEEPDKASTHEDEYSKEDECTCAA
jgi:hypothetical protein